MFINIQIPVIPLSITGNHFRYAAKMEPSNPFSRIWSRKRVMEQWRSKRLVEMHADIDKYFRLLSYRVVCVSFNKEQKKYLGAKEIQSGWYGVMCPLHRPLQVRQWAVWPYSQAQGGWPGRGGQRSWEASSWVSGRLRPTCRWGGWGVWKQNWWAGKTNENLESSF